MACLFAQEERSRLKVLLQSPRMSLHVAIIGAGPAGSVAAFLLARQGWKVTLIEQHRFPRDKVCGECLSALGIQCLDRMGLGESLGRMNPVLLTHAAVHPPRGASARFALSDEMWGISRGALDQFLLDAARNAGATVLQPVRCERINDGDSPSIQLRRLDSNTVETRQFDWVLLADGKGTLAGDPPPRTSDFGIKAHFDSVDGPRDTIELFGCEGLYGGLAAIESGGWNAAFSVPAHRLRQFRGNIPALFASITSENRMLRRRLARAHRTSEWLAAPLPRFPVREERVNHGTLPIGNAAAAIEPIGGEGMGLAIRSAELTAEFLANANLSPSLRALDGDFRRLWRIRRPACRTAALVVSRPQMANLLLPMLGRLPRAVRPALRLLGK